MVRTVLFDLDGTLLDTLTDLSNSVNFALRTHLLPERTIQEIRAFLGNGIRNLIEKSVPLNTSTEVLDKVFLSFKTHYLKHGLDYTAPYSGIIPLLERLKEKSIKMAIISNKVDAAVQQLNSKFFAHYMDIAVGEKTNVRRKPAPDSVLYAIQALGAQPETTLYIGDSEVDFETAQAAGVRCVLVTWGFRDESDLHLLKSDYYANSSEELYNIITNS